MAAAKIKKKLKAFKGIFSEGNFSDKFRLLWLVLAKNLREIRVRYFMDHIHGPRRLSLNSNEVAVLCLFRDGMTFLPHYLDHHRKLGVSHFVFIDNGSVDGSTEFIKAQPDTTLFHSRLFFGDYKHTFKKFLCEEFGTNNWGLLLDIDECFDFPMSDQITLQQFISYLEANGYNTVVANLLDMFSNQAILELVESQEDMSAMYQYYDLTHLDKADYNKVFGTTNQVANDRIQTLIGGVRKRFFNTAAILTKHPLFRLEPGVACVSNCHDIRFAKVADITAVMYHYKYNKDFKMIVQRALDEKGYYGGAGGYKIADDELSRNPKLSLFTADSCKLNGTAELVEKGFILISDTYGDWVNANSTDREKQEEALIKT